MSLNNNVGNHVIVDVDVGTDDFMALLILFYAEQLGTIKIDAIMCCHGNASVENVCKNVIRLLELIGRTDVPVYKGAAARLIRPDETYRKFHGDDGFGDLEHDHEPDISVIKSEPAPIALQNIVSANPKQVSLICLGPLTNLALTIKLYSNFVDNLKDVWIMGGNHSGVGNITSSAEFNFYSDPEASYIAFECLKCPIYLLPWESCLVSNIPMEWRFDTLGAKTPAMELLTRAEKAVYGKSEYTDWLPCDAFLAFVYLNPEKYIKKSTKHHATVELFSSYTRGQVVLDHMKNKLSNITVIEEIETKAFVEYVLQVGTKFI